MSEEIGQESREELTRFGLSSEQWDSCESASRVAQETLTPVFKALTEKLVGEFASSLNDAVMLTMEFDVEYNFRSMVRGRCNEIIFGLLNGGWREERVKEWIGSCDAEGFRSAIYEKHRDVVQNALIEDLKQRVKQLESDVTFYRVRYS